MSNRSFRYRDFKDFQHLLKTAPRLDKNDFDAVLAELSEAYYNKRALISDNDFDRLEKLYEELYGRRDVVGARPLSGRIISCPVLVGGTTKVRDNESFLKQLAKLREPVSIMPKYNGVSAILLSLETGLQLVTRGDMKQCSDISHLIPFLQLPEYLEIGAHVRGEIVLHKDTDYKAEGYENNLGMIVGLVNSIEVDRHLGSLLHFIAFEVMNMDLDTEPQLDHLSDQGFETTLSVIYDARYDDIELYESWSRNLDYPLDGLVYYDCSGPLPPKQGSKFTRGIFARKFDDVGQGTIVTGIEWNISINCVYKPTVIFDEVEISGAKISRATGNNYQWMIDHNISLGACVVITRSGSVIPTIQSLIKPGNGDLNLPTGKNIYVDGRDLKTSEQTNQQRVKFLANFLKKIGIKQMGESRCQGLVDAGLSDLAQLYHATPDQIQKAIVGDSNSKVDWGIAVYSGLRVSVELSTFIVAANLLPRVSLKKIDQLIEDSLDRRGSISFSTYTGESSTKASQLWKEKYDSILELIEAITANNNSISITHRGEELNQG